MPIDLQQLLPTFIEESLENVEEMEEALLKLDLTQIDIEQINQIFRAVHTIKGNSTIFKFSDINQLAKTLENLLDNVRKKTLQLEQQHVDFLLKSSDHLRNMLLEIKNKDMQTEETENKAQATPTLTSIRVATEKIDTLMNTVEELVITESVLKKITEEMGSTVLRKFNDNLDDLEQQSRRLQEVILRMRMVPIAYAINRFPRMVQEISQQLGKKIEFKISGEQTEIDKTMVEKITDPLMHLIRNAIDHGIETPSEREKVNKSKEGVIELSAYQSGDNLIIDIKDDGAGLNASKIKATAINKGLIARDTILTEEECYQLIFQPGFSTAEKVTDISGRGVGLDVVIKNIHELSGKVEIISKEGFGTTFRLRLPLTLAIIDCQLIKVGNAFYAVPLSMILEMCELNNDYIVKAEDNMEHYTLREETFKLIHLDKLLSLEKENSGIARKFLLKIKSDEIIVGFTCSALLSQQQMVIKSIEENYSKIPGILGATVLGDGELALILDVKEIVHFSNDLASLTSKTVEPLVSPIPQSQEKNEKMGSADYLCFLVENKEYALDMQDIKEVCVWQKHAFLPFSPLFIKGIINMRGKIVPVIDPRILFNLNPCDYNFKNVIIVFKTKYKENRMYVGLIVDSVTETKKIFPEDVELALEALGSKNKPQIKGVANIKGKEINLLRTDCWVTFLEKKLGVA